VISNAAFSRACSSTTPYAISITQLDAGHYLAGSMPQGECSAWCMTTRCRCMTTPTLDCKVYKQTSP
jgi:hypothetical protein